MDPSMTPANMHHLIDRLFNYQNLNTEQRRSLYADMEEVSHFLKSNKENAEPIIKERVSGLANNILKAVNSHGVGEATLLAKWLASHKHREGIGANEALQHLFDSIVIVREQAGMTTSDLYQLKYIITASEDRTLFEDKKIPFLDLDNIQRELLFGNDKINLELNELLNIRDVSEAHRETVNQILIKKLNAEEIYFEHLRLSPEDLHRLSDQYKLIDPDRGLSIVHIVAFFGKENIKKIRMLQVTEDGKIHPKARRLFSSVDQIHSFFKEDCQKILTLSLSEKELIVPFSYQLRNLFRTPNIYEFSAKELSEKLISYFPNLINLELNITLKESTNRSIIKIHDLKLPKLESIEIKPSHGDVLDIEFVKDLSNLKRFVLPKFCQIIDHNFLGSCKKLEELDVWQVQLSSLNFLITCPDLKILRTECLSSTDVSVLENLTNLTHIEICSSSPNVGSILTQKSLNLSKLKKLEILNLMDFTIQELNLSGCSNLANLSLIRIKKLETLDLKNCIQLKRMELYQCEIKNLIFLENRSVTLTKLKILQCPKIKISSESAFPILVALYIGNSEQKSNIEFVKNCPNLEILEMQNIEIPNSDTLLEFLPSKLKSIIHGMPPYFDVKTQEVLKQREVEYHYY